MRSVSRASTTTAVADGRRGRHKAMTRSAATNGAAATESGDGRSRLYCGLDFGTSSARLALVDDDGRLVRSHARGYEAPDSKTGMTAPWLRAMWELLEALDEDERGRMDAVAVDGTSGTVIIVDAENGEALCAPYMYNDTFPDESARIRGIRNGPGKDSTESASSAACKLSRWFYVDGAQSGDKSRATLLHHADWLAYQLHGRMGVSDFNNSLKLGFDPAPGVEAFPKWLRDAEFGYMLPSEVLAPGASFGRVRSDVADRLACSPSCEVIAGTTDSVAAFVASQAMDVGECATSLGSTLALKLISDARVDDLSAGVYSHRLNGRWLVGGASNLGGWILRRFFSNDELEKLSARIDEDGIEPTEDYFEGVMLGFGVSVDEAASMVESSRPNDDAQFVANLLGSIANVEARCYERMRELGASSGARKVFTAGGGARNATWSAMRSSAMGGIPVVRSERDEAAYGAALLARQGRKGLDSYVPT